MWPDTKLKTYWKHYETLLCYFVICCAFLELDRCRWHCCAQCWNIGPASASLHPAAHEWHSKESLTLHREQPTPKVLRSWPGLSISGTMWRTCMHLSVAQSLGFQKLLELWTVRVCSWAIHSKKKRHYRSCGCGFPVHRGLFRWPRNPWLATQIGSPFHIMVALWVEKKLTFNSGKL